MKKILCFGLITSMMFGCSAARNSEMGSSIGSSEEKNRQTSVEKEKKEKPAENTVTFGDYTLTAPEDWVFDTQEESVFTGNNQQYKAHVIYAYKGAIDKTNPYIALSSFEIVGVGGENFPEECFENQTIGDHTYDVIYNEYPYSLTTFNHSTEDNYGKYSDPSYCFLMRNDFGSQSITFNYYQHGGPEWNSEEVESIIASLKLNRIGELEVTEDNSIRYGGSSSDEVKDWIYVNSKYPSENTKFAAYEVKEDGDTKWYRVGDYSWIEDGGVQYTAY